MPTQFDGLDRFIQRVEQARRAGSKEVRFSILEATEAGMGLALLLSRLTVLEAAEQAASAAPGSKIDGGGMAG